MMLAGGQELSARYVLVRELGRGGHGAVWLARDLERGMLVAVHILSNELTQVPAVLAAIEANCVRARQFEHPNLLRIHAFCREGERAWIVMEHASGGDLSALRGRPAAEIIQAAIDVAGALAYLHDEGWVHRDVKVSNVLLASDGRAVLADFSAMLATGSAPELNVSIGSPYSASPQQLAGEPASTADDVYAFGVLLYELLTGYPPFYPDISEERVRNEPVPPPAGRHPVPAPLAELVGRCLAKEPGDRPRVGEVLESLRQLRSELRSASRPKPDAPTLVPPVGQGAPIRPQWQRPQAPAASSATALRREGFRRGLLAAAAAVLAIAALIVFFVLPDWVARQRPEVAATPPSELPATTAPPAEEKVDYAALAQLQREAEQLREAIDPRLQQLAAQGVERWGAVRYANARDQVAAGDTAFAARRYEDAKQAFERANAEVEALEQAMPDVLANTLADGTRALAEGRSEDAATAFDLALAIDADNAQARAGAARAATLDQVLALVSTGERLERDGDLAGARDAFVRAVELDAAMPRASEGLARVRAGLAEDAYRTVLARGFAAQANGDPASARRAFGEALKMRPGAAEPQRALAQLDQEARTAEIAGKLDAARALEDSERWQEALTVYREILQIDPTVAFAQEGVARTEPRAELHGELELYLTQPERLFSSSVRVAAREALAKASAIASPGPVLTRQIRTLDDWLRRAETPVTVALQSDNATRVTIYRVGDLGTFERRSLELMPGKYTVVGTRPGYRDVRRELTVTPGAGTAQVEIRCEERI
jgi:tetratricopeptide (TPR) repeat protein